jgi:hypothetical protein
MRESQETFQGQQVEMEMQILVVAQVALVVHQHQVVMADRV